MLRTIFLFLILLGFPMNLAAALPEAIKDDFAVVAGTVIMPVGQEYLVDLDASNNLHVGDILTLTGTGEQVIHPETQEVLGTLDVIRGFLRVTEIKSGYSYAELLTAETAPVKGDQVKRFNRVPAVFQSDTNDRRLQQELQQEIPQLDWQPDSADPAAQLIFQLAGNQLTVMNAAGTELHTYPYSDGALATPYGGGATRPDSLRIQAEEEEKGGLLDRTVDNLFGKLNLGSEDKRLEHPGIIQAQPQAQDSGIWIGPNLGGNPVGMAVADFDQDGQLETAVAMEDHLKIYRITAGELQPQAQVDFPGGISLLSLAAFDADHNGQPEIYLSAHVGTELRSQVVEFGQGRYRRTITRIPWFLNTVKLENERTVLVGQSAGNRDKPFAQPPFVIKRSKDQLERGTNLNLPKGMNVFNFTPISDADGLLYANISGGDYLQVKSRAGELLWESAEHFGGSEVSYLNSKDLVNELAKPVYIQPGLLNLPGGEVLAPQNLGPRLFQAYRNFSKSRVVALQWDGFALKETWRTSVQGGYLADFVWADANNDGQKELVMVVKYSQKNLVQNGRSNIVLYELPND